MSEEVSLVMDSASVGGPGGERLQVELAAAVDRTCPPGARAVVLRRSDQTGISGLVGIRDECIDVPLATPLDKWRWFREELPRRARRLGATAVFAGSGIVSRRLHRECGIVATTNNMVPFSPEQVRRYGVLSSTRVRWALVRALTVRSLRMADAVVLHSEHALRTISGFAGDISPKTTVVLTGVPQDARLEDDVPPPEHPNGDRPYFLYFSAIKRYKNHIGLIEAYRRLSERVEGAPELKLAGVCKDPEYLAEVREAISRTALNGKVSYLGEVSRRDLSAWLHHATVNVFPSLCETNSVIQAEILGVRGVMAASDIPPISEVAGEAAELFDPRDPSDICRVLERLWRDPARRDELRRLAAERVRSLSWDACGEAIWQAARDAGARYRRRAA